ncbi:hypothetical protein GUF81_23405 [Xanthomonas citri pv. citri]|nr:hypothetical protein [Xanthomonas citri pv. citri]
MMATLSLSSILLVPGWVFFHLDEYKGKKKN